MVAETAFLDELRRIGALKEGHYLLSSGRHSGQYVEKFDLLRQPRETESACGMLIERLGPLAAVDLVVGPTTGGILLAFEMARQLGLPAAYAERLTEGSSERAFKRGTTIEPGTRVLLVDDILTTGGSVRESLAALQPWQVNVVAIAVLVDRSAGQVDFGVPLVGLTEIGIETWDPAQCPLCRDGAPIIKPGSTAVQVTGTTTNQ